MKKKIESAFYLVMLALATAGPSTSAAAASPSSETGPQADERSQNAMLDYLRPALQASHKAGRLNYVLPCNTNSQYPLSFPNLKARASSRGKDGLEAVREIFRNDRRVTVSEEPDGIIRINVGRVPAQLLQTKIRLVNFKPIERFTPALAVEALTNARDVEATIRILGLQQPQAVDSIVLEHPTKGRPHLPAVMRNVTMDQALDAIARTFGVLIVFGQCTSRGGPNFFDVHVVFL